MSTHLWVYSRMSANHRSVFLTQEHIQAWMQNGTLRATGFFSSGTRAQLRLHLRKRSYYNSETIETSGYNWRFTRLVEISYSWHPCNWYPIRNRVCQPPHTGISPRRAESNTAKLPTIGFLHSLSKTVENTVTTDTFDIIQVTACYTNVIATKLIGLKPRSVTPVTVVSTARGLLRFEPDMAPVQRQHLLANCVMEVMANIPLHILLTNVSNQDVHVPKHMIMGQQCSNLTRIVTLNQFPPDLNKEPVIDYSCQYCPKWQWN